MGIQGANGSVCLGAGETTPDAAQRADGQGRRAGVRRGQQAGHSAAVGEDSMDLDYGGGREMEHQVTAYEAWRQGGPEADALMSGSGLNTYMEVLLSTEMGKNEGNEGGRLGAIWDHRERAQALFLKTPLHVGDHDLGPPSTSVQPP